MSSHRARSSFSTGHRAKTVLAALAVTLLAPLAATAQCTVTTLADTGTGSLRACITAANAANTPQTITFSPSLNGGIITVGSTLEITASMTINGPGANLLTISGGNAVQIFDIGGSPDTVIVNISSMTIANGNIASGGGGILNNGTLTVNNSTFFGNSGRFEGGGILNIGYLTVNNSTFSGNTAGSRGGGIFTGLASDLRLTVNNSTFFGNTASDAGGGIYLTDLGVLTINNSTISGNTASSGGGVHCTGGTTATVNSIVAGNTSTAQAGDDYDGCGTPSSSLISIPSAIVNPQLSPLGWYGGPTQTMLPLPGSPAIGAGAATQTDNPNMDQRGFSRPTMGAIDIGAVQTNYLLVTTTADVSDMPPACDASGDSPCSLRDALTLANGAGSADIAFVGGLVGVITLNSSLAISGNNLDLVGPGANLLTVSGGGSSAVGDVFDVYSGNVAISGITIANASGGVAGLDNENGATVAVSYCAFSGNSSIFSTGGIYNGNGSKVFVTGSTFSGNTGGEGGAIHNFGATVIVSSSTFTANFGGAIFSYNDNLTPSTLVVNNSTFSGNTAIQGGAIYNGGYLTVNNSILTADAGGECYGAGCPTNGVGGNVVDPAPAQSILSALGWYGGPTQTMLPLPGSPATPAICAGSVSLNPAGLTTDQRGFPRTNLASGCLDAGAVQTNYLLVTTTTDVLDVSPPAACDAASDSPCSLRDALTLAASNGSADIAFAANVTGTIDLSTVNTPAPTITGNLDLFGPGANNITVSGGGSGSVGSVFNMISPNAAISGITVFNGNSEGNGGGLYNSGATTLSNIFFSGNSAPSGGAIYNNSGVLIVNASTFAGGFTQFGGGIYNNGGILVVAGSTLFNNNARAGGGIFSESTMVINNSTVSGNPAAFGAGIWIDSGSVTLSNSIVAGNSPGDDCDGCGNQSASNLINIDPMLAGLGSFGGPTPTMLPLPGSPAICAGSAALDPGSLATDQRGFPRLNTTYTGFSTGSPCLDLGAVQTNYQSVQFAQASYSGRPNAAVSIPAAPVVSVTENGQNIGSVPVTLSFMGTQPNSSSGLGPVTTVGGTGATFNALEASPGGSYTLLASLAITPSVTISNTAGLDIANPATVTSLTSTTTNGTYTTGAVIYITVNFSNPVTVTGTPQLALNSGGTATYSSGSPGTALVFSYTVASPQRTSALDAYSRTALKLNGGTIQYAGQPAILTLPTPGATGSLSANSAIVINAIQYQLTTSVLPAGAGTVLANPTSTPNVTPMLPTGTYLAGTQVQLTATPANAGYSFADWTQTRQLAFTPAGNTANPITITMNGQITETAHFTVNTVGVTINTSPQGLLVSVDNGAPAAAPVNLTWVIGKQHRIATTTPQNNGTLYNFAGWSDMGAISHVVTATASTTSYTASFAAPPTIGKAFIPNAIQLGGFSTLSFTINNPSATLTQTGVFFRDTFPAGMQVVGTPNATNTCGGTFTAPAGATAVHLNGGSLAPGAICTLSVLVKATTVAVLGNTTSAIVSTNAGTGATSNTATLTVYAPATITLPQHISTDAGATRSSSLAFPSSNTGGNFIAVVVRGGVSNEVFTVQDSARNMYQKAVQLRVAGSPGGESLAIYYAENIAAGANTVTVSQSVSATLRFAILEYSGIARAYALDRVASAQGTSATPNSGSVTTTTSGDLLLAGILSVDSETYTPGNEYTAEEAVPAQPNTKLLIEQQVQSADGPVSAGATLGGIDPWGVVLAAFHPASAVITK